MCCGAYEKYNKKMEKRMILEEELIEHFDESITDEIEHFVINTVFKNSRYMFIRKVKSNIFLYGENRKFNKYYAYCTHCKEEYEIDEYLADSTFHHNNKCQCPKCRSKCIAKHERYGRSKLRDTSLFITYDKSKIDAGTIVAKGYCVTRDYTENYKQVTTQYTNLSRFVFTLGNSYMLTERSYHGWYIRERCCSYKDGYGNYNDYVDTESITRAVSNTKFRYSPYKAYMQHNSPYRQDDMTLFFYQYSKYPIVEKLMKSGFEAIADNIVQGRSLERSVNYKQTDLFKFLGINRGEMKEIRESGIECSPSFLRLYKYAKKEKLGWNIKKVIKESKEYKVETLKKIKKYAGINKTLTYLEKQEATKNEYSSFITTWFDYLRDCEKLEMNLKDKSTLFPKSLDEAHIKTIKQIRYVADKGLNEKIKKLAKKREIFKYKYNDLIIRPALDTIELIIEGEKLHHCVGGYAKTYAENRTNILLIRKEEAIEAPYFTMEVSREGEIIQVRGERNCGANEEVKKFIEKYKKEVLVKLSKRKKKKAA